MSGGVGEEGGMGRGGKEGATGGGGRTFCSVTTGRRSPRLRVRSATPLAFGCLGHAPVPGGVGTRAFLRSTHPDGSNDAPGESAVWTTSVRRASGSSSSRSPTASLEPGSDGAAICAGRHDVVSESSSSASASLPSRPATAGRGWG